MYNRIIVETVQMLFMVILFILLQGQRMISERLVNGERIR